MTDNWIEIGTINDIPRQGARIVRNNDSDIAVFRTDNDEIFALRDHCPHKGGPLSQGIVHDKKVTCPMHNWNISLDTGLAVEPDEGCAMRYPIKLEGDRIFLSLAAE